MPIRRPCLNCQQLTTNGTRCPTCQAWRDRAWDSQYAKRATAVREQATLCWLCGEGPREDDPWTADHVLPANPNSPLRPAHRSCNSSRGNRPPPHTTTP